MTENQNIEYKQSWHDDHLKWVCGFANSQGGSLFVGIDDHGNVTGVPNAKKLLEDLPNKIRDSLGLMPEVNLLEKNGAEYIQITTMPYSVPISFRAKYYVRSGSTLQELKGNALNEFLLKKVGKSWDDVIEPNASYADIDEKSVEDYLKAAEKSGRLPEIGRLDIPAIFENLRLVENNQLKRAAIILFGKDPGKFYSCLTVKMGRFGKSHDDLKFTETEDGNLIQLLRKVTETLNHKFFIKPIHFEGLLRIEKNEYPVAAIREMLLNALVHRDYMGSNIQIRIYDNQFSMWNEGGLPHGLSEKSLKLNHSSRPRNTLLADVCFKGGYIDAWGRGTLKIINSCLAIGLPEPKIQEVDGGIRVTLFKDKFSDEFLAGLGLSQRQLNAITFVKNNKKITNPDYQKINQVSESTALRDIEDLLHKKIFKKEGEKKGAYYEFSMETYDG